MHVNRLPHAFMRLQDIKHGEVFSWADDEPPSVADVFMRFASTMRRAAMRSSSTYDQAD